MERGDCEREASRRYPDTPAPGDSGLREAEAQLLGALYVVNLLKAASHTLRSYEFGNSDPTSAKYMADQIDAALSRPVQTQGDKPIVVERYADNGEHSHWDIIRTDGVLIVSYPPETIPAQTQGDK